MRTVRRPKHDVNAAVGVAGERVWRLVKRHLMKEEWVCEWVVCSTLLCFAHHTLY